MMENEVVGVLSWKMNRAEPEWQAEGQEGALLSLLCNVSSQTVFLIILKGFFSPNFHMFCPFQLLVSVPGLLALFYPFL